MRSPGDAQEIERIVRGILKDELTADSAARIALVNNRDVQATLQDLGLAQADLAQASRLSNPDLHGFLRSPNREPGGKNYEISLVQDFLNILVQPLRKKFAAAELEVTKLRVGHELMRTMADTKVAFFTLAGREQLATRLALILDIEQTAVAFARRNAEGHAIHVHFDRVGTVRRLSEHRSVSHGRTSADRESDEAYRAGRGGWRGGVDTRDVFPSSHVAQRRATE